MQCGSPQLSLLIKVIKSKINGNNIYERIIFFQNTIDKNFNTSVGEG